jgi:hypothetical protein
MTYPRLLSVLTSLLFLILPGTAAFAGRAEAVREGSVDKNVANLKVPQNEDLTIPNNIQAPYDMRHILNTMLRRSATFRAQCRVLRNAANVRIRLTLLPPGYYSFRAVSNVRRFAGGIIMIEMRFIAPSDYIEMIGHEFEHAVEQAEGLDMRELEASGSSQVYEVCGGGGFESRRAINAGLAVAREYYSKRYAAYRVAAVKGATKPPTENRENVSPVIPALNGGPNSAP